MCEIVSWEEQGGYYRVQVIADEDILVDHYSGEWQYISQQWIQRELPIFGGFYEGKNAFFVCLGSKIGKSLMKKK